MKSLFGKIFLICVMSAAAVTGLCFLGAEPVPLAAAYVPDEKPFAVKENGEVTRYAELSAAMDAALEGGRATVYLGGTAEFSQINTVDIDLTLKKLDSSAVIVRAENFTGELFHVNGGASLTLDGITFDGMDYEAASAAIVSEGTLTLTNETAFTHHVNASSETWGSAVYAASGSETILRGAIFSENSCVQGGDIAADGKLTTSENNRFSSGGDGCAVYALASARLDIGGTLISDGEYFYLSDGATMDISNLSAYASTVGVKVSATRPDGPVVTSGKKDADFSRLVSLAEPALFEGYLPDYAYRARFLCTQTLESGALGYGYGGVGVNVSEEKADKLSFTAYAAGAESATLILDGEVLALTPQDGLFSGERALPSSGVAISAWSAELNIGGKAIGQEFSDPIYYIRIDRAAATYAAPANTYYMGAEKTPLPEQGLLPNDLAIDESGVAEFYFGERSRRVYTGRRAVRPEDCGGKLYDAYNAGRTGYLKITGVEGVDYALMRDGAFVTDADGGIIWKRTARDNNIISFEGLEIDAAYFLAVRASAGENELAGIYEVSNTPFRTLTAALNTARTAFVDLHTGYFNKPDAITEDAPAYLADVLSGYLGLDASLQALPALIGLYEEAKGALPEAFIKEWRAKHGGVADLEIVNDKIDECNTAIKAAANDYIGLAANVEGMFGKMLTPEECAAVAQAAAQGLSADYEAVIGKAREAAYVLLDIDYDYLLTDYALVDNMAAQNSMKAVKDEYSGLIGEVPATVHSMDDIGALVAEAGKALRVQAYFEVHAAAGRFTDALSDALAAAKQSVKGAEGVNEYDAMLGLYKEYAWRKLQADMGGAGFEDLYAHEHGRIAAVAIPAEAEKNKSALPPLEEEIETILAQAEVKRGVQDYYNKLNVQTEGRLSSSGLKDAAPLNAALEAAFEAIEAAEGEGREAAAEAGKEALYKALALALLGEHYSALYADKVPAEGLKTLYEAAVAAIGEQAGAGDLSAFETQISDLYFSAIRKLAVRAYFDGLVREKGELAPAESMLAELYGAIDAAAFGEKERAGYTAMLALYKAYAVKAIEELNTNSEAADKGDHAEQGRAAAEAVELGEGPFEDALAAAEAKLDAAVEDVNEKLLIEAYFEKKLGSSEGLKAARDRAVAAVGEKQTAEEKSAAGYEGRRSMYEAYTVNRLGAHFNEKYPAPSDALSALLEEAASDVKDTQLSGYSDDALAEAEREMEEIFANAVQKFAVRAYFDGLVRDKGGLAPDAAALEEIYAAIAEAEEKEEAAFAGMVGLYLAYGENAVRAARALHGASEALDGIESGALAALQNAAEQSFGSVEEAQEFADGIIQKAAADMMQKDREEIFAEIEALQDALFEELNSFTQSRLKELEKEEIEAACQTAESGIRESIDEEDAASLSAARARIPEIYIAFAKAIVNAYAAALGETADFAAVEGAEGQAARRNAMYDALLAVYKKHAVKESKAYAAFAAEAEEKINGEAFGDRTDAGLAALEAAVDAHLASAKYKQELFTFHTALAEAQGLSGQLDEALQAQYEAIDGAQADEKENKYRAAVAALAEKAMRLYAVALNAPADEIAKAAEAFTAEKADTMSATLVSEEKKLLQSYVSRSLASYETGGAFSAVDALIASERSALGELLSAEEDILPLTASVRARIGGLPAAVLGVYYDAIAEGYPAHAALPSIAAKRDELAASASDADTAHEAVLALQCFFAEEVLGAARLDTDSKAAADILEGGIAAAASLAERAPAPVTARSAAEISIAISSKVVETLVAVTGQRLLDGAGYAPKDFDGLNAADAASRNAASAAYGAADAEVKAYLDGRLKGDYDTFGARLLDERDKIAFETARAEALESISALCPGEDGELVSERRAYYRDEIAQMRFLPVSEREEDLAASLASLGRTVSLAEEDVKIALGKEKALAAIQSAYAARSGDAFVTYSDAGKAALQAARDGGLSAVRAVVMDASAPAPYETAQAVLDGIVEDAEAELDGVKVIASSKGVKADGEGGYDAAHEAADLWGIIENEGGMSATAKPQMKIVTADAPQGAEPLVGDKEVKAVFEITLSNETFGGTYTVKLLLPDSLAGIEGMQVVAIGADGAEDLTVRTEGNFLVFETTHFSRFYLYGEREVDLWWVIFILTFLLVVELVFIVWLAAGVYRKLNGAKKQRAASVAASALLVVLLPRGTVIVSIVLSVLIAVAGIAIGVLIYILKRRPREEREERRLEKIKRRETARVTKEEEARVRAAREQAVREKAAEEAREKVVSEEAARLAEEARKAETEAQEEACKTEETAAQEEAEPYEQLTIFDLPEEEQTPAAPAQAEESGQLSIFDLPEEHPAAVEEEQIEPPVTVEEQIEQPVLVAEEPTEQPVLVAEEPTEQPAEAVADEQAEQPAEEAAPIEDTAPVAAAVIIETELERASLAEAIEEAETAPEEAEEPSETTDEEAAEADAEESAEEAEGETEVSEEHSEQPSEQPALVEAQTEPEAPMPEDGLSESEKPSEETEQETEQESEPSVLSETPPAEVIEEEVTEAVTEEQNASAETPVVLEEIPEEYQLPVASIRTEVAASEVNGLMQDALAKTLIEESVRVADKSKSGIVNVDTLGEYFESGERVTLEELKKRVPFFGKKVTYVKVLARGRLSKALIVEGDDFSLEAVKMIALVGGHVIRTRRK